METRSAVRALHIVCPNCQTINRVPEKRLSEHPTCGSCRKPLFSAHPIELTAATFERHISRNDIPLLVDFWAAWCGPCKMMEPAYLQATAILEPEFRLGKLNTETEQAVAARYDIRSIPTLILFKQGRVVARQAGAMGAQDIVRWARSHRDT